jgi:uncharacterized protein YodC (DUF2158 family)
MAIVPGDVVCLKSGGQPLTVAAVDDESIDCMWLGEEGELFRETIPSIALIKVDDAIADEDDSEDDDEDEHEDDELAQEENAGEEPARRKSA